MLELCVFALQLPNNVNQDIVREHKGKKQRLVLCLDEFMVTDVADGKGGPFHINGHAGSNKHEGKHLLGF